MNLFTEQKQTHRHREQPYGYQRAKCGWEISKYKLLYIYKIDKQQGPSI